MALFNFLKNQEKKEKQAIRASKKHESSATEEKEVMVTEKQAVSVPHVEDFVLITPHITERARDLSEKNKYTFRVKQTATKKQIETSVTKLYKVHVEGVNIVKTPEKKRRRGLTEGVKKGYKKAIVSLRKGETIDIF